MKEKIKLEDYTGVIVNALPKGLLLNSQGEKFNSMVISWGHLGRIWNVPTFIAYVRNTRYTKAQIDATREFSISVPLDKPNPTIFRICGSQSGRDIDKVKEAGLTLEAPETIATPGVKEYPLTLECRVLYSQKQDHLSIPADLRAKFYPDSDDPTMHDTIHDPHTAYIAEIVDAYIIR